MNGMLECDKNIIQAFEWIIQRNKFNLWFGVKSIYRQID